MKTPENRFKRAIAEGTRQIGLWSSSGSAAIVEMLGPAGYDWILLDTEHAPSELPDIIAQMRVLTDSPAEAIVRPAWNDAVLIKRFLDAGARTLLVPFVQNDREAVQAVRAMRYPPHGIRGVSVSARANRYGRLTDYFGRVHDELCLLVQIETRAALENLEAIAAVDGVDVIWLGHFDLTNFLGIPGQFSHPQYRDAVKRIAEAARKHGKAAGYMAADAALGREYLGHGYRMIASGTDQGLLQNAMANLFSAWKKPSA